MTFDSAFHGLSLIFQVFLLDLILSGDNAVVIALSCRSLPPRQLNQALLIGTGAAIGLRVLLTAVVSVLLKVPMLKLIGAMLLIVIGIRLLIEEERGARAAQQEFIRPVERRDDRDHRRCGDESGQCGCALRRHPGRHPLLDDRSRSERAAADVQQQADDRPAAAISHSRSGGGCAARVHRRRYRRVRPGRRGLGEHASRPL